MALTVIRHKLNRTGFTVVLTNTANGDAVFQQYTSRDIENGSTTLDTEETYSNEAKAIARFLQV